MKRRYPDSCSNRRIPVLLAFLLLAAGSAAEAQVRDTTRADTLAADTLAAPRDTVPPPVLVPWPSLSRTGFGPAVWVWDQEALLLSGAVSLLDLLNQIPSLVTLRSGVFLQPEAATHFGGGGARTIVEWDGYELDPLIAPALDLSTIELVHLSEVRVERGLGVLRIRLRSATPETAEPYSRVEAGIGEPNANLFRGLLLTPRFLLGPFGVGIDRLEAEGSGTAQPADMFSAWLRWGLLSQSRGIEFALRSNRLRRDPGSPRPLEYDRTDMVIRARNRFHAGVVSEVYLGTSHVDATATDPASPTTVLAQVARSSAQAGARVAADFPLFGLQVDARWRDQPVLPRLEYGASLRLGGERASLEGEVQRQAWRDGPTLTGWQGRAQVRPFGSVRLFGEYSAGERGTPDYTPGVTAPPYVSSRTGWRAGLELEWWRLSGGGAALHMETDSIAPFGLPNEPATAFLGETVTGWEAWGRFALVPDWLFLYGSYTRWMSGITWAYLPLSQYTGGIELHGLPLESGNLELMGSLEARGRDVMLAPVPIAGDPLIPLESRVLLDGYFQIRIIDVRIFIRLNDLLGQEVLDLPGLPVSGPRLFYGVKWNFWN